MTGIHSDNPTSDCIKGTFKKNWFKILNINTNTDSNIDINIDNFFFG